MWGMFTDREEEPPFDLGTFCFVKKKQTPTIMLKQVDRPTYHYSK